MDTRNGQRRFGNIGRQYDLAPPALLENALLLLVAEARVQRQHLVLVETPPDPVGRLPDLALAREKHERVLRA